MDTKKIIYIGVAVAVLGILAAAAWSERKISRLEAAVADAKAAAEVLQQSAATKEIEAAGYKQKAAYLESEIDKLQQISRKQNEKLSIQNTNTRRARTDAIRARGERPNDIDREELCQKLAKLGHECEGDQRE